MQELRRGLTNQQQSDRAETSAGAMSPQHHHTSSHAGGAGQDEPCCSHQCWQQLCRLWRLQDEPGTPSRRSHLESTAYIAPVPAVALRTRPGVEDEQLQERDVEQRRLLPKWTEQSHNRARGQEGGAASTSASSAAAAHGGPALLPPPSTQPLRILHAGAGAPLGLGTPAGPGATAAAAGAPPLTADGTQGAGAAAAAAARAARQHRRTQSGSDHGLATRTPSRTSAQQQQQQQQPLLPGQQPAHGPRHTKRLSFTPHDFAAAGGKGALLEPPGGGNGGGAAAAGAAAAGGVQSASAPDGGAHASLSLEDDDDDSHFCSTCLEPYTEDNPKTVTACGHHFHLPCLYEWLERKDTCPMCSKPLMFDGMA